MIARCFLVAGLFFSFASDTIAQQDTDTIRTLQFQAIETGEATWAHWGDSPNCLLYTSDAADDLLCVDLGGRRIIKKKISNS